MDFAYFVFGLVIRSNVELPALPALAANHARPDLSGEVRFHLGQEPYADAMNAPREAEMIYASPYTDEAGALLLRIWKDADGSFLRLSYVDGTQFWMDRSRGRVFAAWPDNLTIENALSYLLGPVFGLLLRLRGVVCLHASAVAFGDCSVAFVGAEGAGKSTTAAAFAARGYGVLSDDIVALNLSAEQLPKRESGSGPISPDAESFRVLPAYPHLSLWPDSAIFLYGSAERLPKLAPEWEKRKLALGTIGTRFETRALPLAAVYLFAERAADSAPRIAPAPLKEALLSLVANTYANSLLDAAMRAEEFAVLSTLVAAVPMRVLTPHRDPARIGELCDLIHRDFAALKRGGR